MNKPQQANGNLKAIGIYIFGGSQSIGHLQCGFKINTILEMTEDMIENNSYHFVKNYKDSIKVYRPSEWNNESFLNNLYKEKYDLFFANNPCSGLSTINKNASINQPVNNRFFEIFDLIQKINPKVFLIENAPTLVTIGVPILHKMVNQLGDYYNFTIIRDYAGNHNVCMKRMRTLIIGWNKKYFKYIPIINMNKQDPITIDDVLKDLSKDSLNMEFDKDLHMKDLEWIYPLIEQGSSVIRTIIKNYDKVINKVPDKYIQFINNQKRKLEEGKSLFDKSAWRLKSNYIVPSMTSLAQYIHPTEDRELYIREYARIMGYPDDFKFYPNECKCRTIQCLAQGVPVNFIKYISNEIIRCLTKDYNYIDKEIHVNFQNHSKKVGFAYTKDEFYQVSNLIHNDSNVNFQLNQ